MTLLENLCFRKMLNSVLEYKIFLIGKEKYQNTEFLIKILFYFVIEFKILNGEIMIHF
jgi:hypothetical protein